MIDVERYNKLKEMFGYTSSWTIWKEAGSKAKSNTDDMSIFDYENICDKLNDNYVFVALNPSKELGEQKNKPWTNFHSSSPYQNDFKLRYALTNTKFWGIYITDVIKEVIEVDSTLVKEYLKKYPQIIDKNIKIFEEELKILSDQKPILIAIGNDSYDILNDNLSDKYTIYKITHYSSRKANKKEDYRKDVLSILNSIWIPT